MPVFLNEVVMGEAVSGDNIWHLRQTSCSLRSQIVRPEGDRHHLRISNRIPSRQWQFRGQERSHRLGSHLVSGCGCIPCLLCLQPIFQEYIPECVNEYCQIELPNTITPNQRNETSLTYVLT